jgi:acyl-CoA synthetase (NDP forming)/RimJ/RimL family protein N-acetyltransferase
VTASPSARTYALLTDGSTVEIRPACREDADAVREMHARMSPDNAYRRFFSLSKMAPGQEAKRITREPGPDHAALLAWLGGALIGVASYETVGHQDTAEIAFAVADDMHGRGVATLLLEHLVSLARRRGLQTFTAETLPENSAMLRVFADAGLPAERHFADGLVELRFPLPGAADDQLLASYLDTVASRASRADVASLRPLLQPASVAVVGASRRRGTVGREILRNIVTGGFAGEVYPVNPRARSMEGHACLPSVTDLPEGVDLAVIAVPAAAVTTVAAQCGQRGVRALVVITSGLAGAGPDLLAICRRYGMRLVGPNCFGVGVPGLGLDATFGARHPAPGRAGLVVQSGGVGIALLEQLSRLGIGMSSFASVGDKYDVSSNDMLTWWEQDEKTRLAIMYVESFGNPREFARTARRVARRMPLLTVLGGRSAAGQRAAASHTAAAATPLATQEALFGQAGIIVTHGLGELTEAAALLSCQGLLDGDRIAVVSNAGGAGVLAADACGDHGLQVAVLAAATQRRLARLLPAGAAVAGPVDTGVAVSSATFRACLEEIAADENVDAVLAVAVPTAVSDLTAAICAAELGKPLAAALLDQAEAVRIVRPAAAAAGQTAAGQAADSALAGQDMPAAVPAYASPEGAARALGHAVRFCGWQNRQVGRVPELTGTRTADAWALVARFLGRRRAGGWLPDADAASLLACYQIPLVPTRRVTDEQAAVAAAADLGGRVVLKAEADGLVHKSDAGAVQLDLRTGPEVAEAYRQLAVAFGAGLKRVLVQPMLTGGVEVLIGVVHEPVFGPLVVFGLGGAATEVPGDHAARLTPLTDADADELIRSVHAAPLLFGHRGSAAVDTSGLADILLRVSRLADDLPEVAELDLNPVIARQDAVQAADVRIRVTPAAPKDPFLRMLRLGAQAVAPPPT